MENKQTLKWTIIGVGTILLLVIALNVVSKSNQEVRTRNLFGQKMIERKAFFNKLSVIVKQTKQATVKSDSSLVNILKIYMEGRKDSEGLMMKWITESNPVASYKEVSDMYKALTRTIEAQREGFFQEEKQIADIVREHNNLLDTFPSGFLLSTILGRKKLEYSPITSSSTEEIFRTGREDNTDLF